MTRAIDVANWQRLALVPQEIFDDELKHSPRPTTNGLIKAGTTPKPNQVDPKVLWLWFY
ncbi:hypothetical protein [Methylocystis sp. B8]|uniref:hypothetical protein n=1 Tax=Methylocystis sp. B8 TaxID=544938 RepID=UPI0014852491|nr:hypothetical protein [Methylocystis sp. B8]